MNPGFRRDIQGLRALAVVLVILDHAGIGPFHGGFVGVDVFFVISGFLITGLLVSEAERTGRVSLLGFYARRARRILPAATVVILATVGFGIYFLSAVEADGTIKDALWATFFLANVKFAHDGTDYFQSDTPPSPLQHCWSLAVEEQFYVVWPLLVMLICLYAVPRARRSAGQRSLGPRVRDLGVSPLVVLVGVSFAYSVSFSTTDPVSAYFSPLTRGWELGIGALVACLSTRLILLRQDSLTFIDALRQAALDKDVEFVETARWFCAKGLCPSVVGDYIAHRDRTHISQSYAGYLTDELEARIQLGPFDAAPPADLSPSSGTLAASGPGVS